MASAKQIRDEIMRLTFVVNSDPAQTAINDLRKENAALNESIRTLQKSKDNLGRRNKENAAEWDRLTAEIKKNNETIAANKLKMEEIRGGMDIAKMSMGQLRKEAALLKEQLKYIVDPKSDGAKLLNEQLAKVNDRMAEIQRGAQSTRLSFQSLADKFNHYSGLLTAFAAVLVGFGISVQNIIDRNNKMADAMSGVEKTTGMARSEVEQLTRSFSDFDTRTKKIDLLKIAEVGGRLGVAKSEIKDFTREVDKAYVALGDSWQGGVDKLADSMGRIAGLYAETKNQPIAQSINEIGSALNELAAQGASSEQNIAEFVTRMGSVPEALRPALNELLGFGSAFEESGINAEIGASGLSKFLRVAANNVEGFAKVMNEPVDKIKELINSNPAEFFLKFSEGLKGMDADKMAAILDYLKLNDGEVSKAIGAASANTDRFRQSVQLASDAVREGTSLQEEFNKVNNNAAAIWEKVQRKIAESLTSAAVASFINDSVSAFGKFIGAIEDTEGRITTFRNGLLFLTKIMALVIATMVSYNLVTGVYNNLMRTASERVLALTIVEKARNVVMTLGNAIQTTYRATLWLLAAGYSGLTGNVAGATFAMRGFNATVAANPLGAILTVVTLAATAYFAFADSAKSAEKSQKSFNEVMSEGTKAAGAEVAQLDVLYKTATNVKISTEERTRAVQKLKSEYPGYFKNISDEIIMNGKAANSYRELRNAIIAAARSNAAKTELENREGDRLKRDNEWRNRMIEEQKYNNELKKRGSGRTLVGNVMIDNSELLEASNKRIKNLIDERISFKRGDIAADKIYIDAIQANNAQAAKLNEEREENANSNFSLPAKGDGKGNHKNKNNPGRNNAAERHQREMDNMRRKGDEAAELARQIQLDIEDAKIEAMQEGYDKQIDEINLQEMRKMAEIDKKKVSKTEFDILQKKIDSAKSEDKAFFEQLKKSWTENNASLETLKLNQQAIFENKRKALRFESEKEWLTDQDEAHQKNIARIQREYNEEIAQYQTLEQLKAGLKGRISNDELRKIRTWSEGKEALQKVYLQREMEMQVAHLESMVKLYEGLDMSVLTKEQQKEVLKFIEEAGNKIAEFKAKKASGDQTDKGKVQLQESKVDILGFTPDDWQAFADNIKNGTDQLATMQMAVQALQNGFAMYYKFVEANEKRQLQTFERNTERKKASYKRQLDQGYINQATYKKLTIKADEDLEKKKIEMQMKAAKREKAMTVASIISNTALAVVGALGNKPWTPFNFALAGMVGALGAVQLATVLAQPLPSAAGYEEGYGMEYPIQREQDGKVFNVRRRRLSSMLVDRPTHFIAGENGVEMVIDNPTWTSYSPQLKSAIYSANARAKGFEKGFNTSGENNDELMLKMMAVLHQNTVVMEDIRRNGISAYIAKTARNGKEAKEMIQDFEKIDNKNKH